MDENKSKALAAALAQIEKQFGKGSIMRMDSEVVPDIAVVSTGSLGLDIALGVGGLPRGRVVEIYGPESSGKTTLTLQVIAEMQKMGGTAAFIDAENALDAQYAGKLGVKVDDLLISQPDNGEQALEIADMLVRSGSIDVIVIDSVAALTPKAEIEGEMGEPQMGLQARLMSQALRKLTANIKRTNASTISSACSPVSGWLMRSSCRLTPSFCAYCTSSACSASMKAQVPPSFCISAMTCSVRVVLPLDSGP